MCCTYFTFSYLLLFMVIDVSSMSTDKVYHYDEDYGSGNDSYSGYGNHTFSSEMIDCQCNDTNLMTVDKKFLLKWLSIAEPYSISKLSTAAHKLKVVTEYLQV